MIYSLYNGPKILKTSDDLRELQAIKDNYPAKIRSFLSIGKKGIGCTIKLHSDDIETKDPATVNFLPPQDIPDGEEESQELNCMACGEHINDAGKCKYLSIETHGFDGWDSSLPQPRTPYLCWDCVSGFKRQIQGREYKLTDFFEVRK